MRKRIMAFLFAVLIVLSTVVSVSAAEGVQISQTVNITETTVDEDLLGSTVSGKNVAGQVVANPFNAATYLAENADKGVHVMTVKEWGHPAHSEAGDHYYLFVYICDPNGVGIRASSLSKINLSLTLNEEGYLNYDDPLQSEEYFSIYPMEFRSVSTGDYAGKFYKFAVDLSYCETVGLYSERVFTIQDVELSTKAGPTRTFVQGRRFVFKEDVLQQMGDYDYLVIDDIFSTSFVYKSDVLNRYQQIHSVCFWLPEKVAGHAYEKEGINRIKAEFYEMYMVPILYTSDVWTEGDLDNNKTVHTAFCYKDFHPIVPPNRDSAIKEIGDCPSHAKKDDTCSWCVMKGRNLYYMEFYESDKVIDNLAGEVLYYGDDAWVWNYDPAPEIDRTPEYFWTLPLCFGGVDPYPEKGYVAVTNQQILDAMKQYTIDIGHCNAENGIQAADGTWYSKYLFTDLVTEATKENYHKVIDSYQESKKVVGYQEHDGWWDSFLKSIGIRSEKVNEIQYKTFEEIESVEGFTFESLANEYEIGLDAAERIIKDFEKKTKEGKRLFIFRFAENEYEVREGRIDQYWTPHNRNDMRATRSNFYMDFRMIEMEFIGLDGNFVVPVSMNRMSMAGDGYIPQGPGVNWGGGGGGFDWSTLLKVAAVVLVVVLVLTVVSLFQRKGGGQKLVISVNGTGESQYKPKKKNRGKKE